MRAKPLLLGAVLAGTTWLPFQAQVLSALSAIIVLGVPHGALDGELARTILCPRLGGAWFPIFALPYLALFALVLIAWHVAPVSTLAAFLAMSVWHFRSEDAAGGSWSDKLVRGGLPVAVPMLVHQAATVALFTTITGRALGGFATLWTGAALAWLVLAGVWTGRTLMRRDWPSLSIPGVLLVAFAALPPLTAFAFYFIVVHAPSHTAALIGDERALRIRDARSAWLLALPIMALTVLLGVALWPFYSGAFEARLLALTMQGLAALTLPHMVLNAGFDAFAGSAPPVHAA